MVYSIYKTIEKSKNDGICIEEMEEWKRKARYDNLKLEYVVFAKL